MTPSRFSFLFFLIFYFFYFFFARAFGVFFNGRLATLLPASLMDFHRLVFFFFWNFFFLLRNDEAVKGRGESGSRDQDLNCFFVCFFLVLSFGFLFFFFFFSTGNRWFADGIEKRSQREREREYDETKPE